MDPLWYDASLSATYSTAPESNFTSEGSLAEGLPVSSHCSNEAVTPCVLCEYVRLPSKGLLTTDLSVGWMSSTSGPRSVLKEKHCAIAYLLMW